MFNRCNTQASLYIVLGGCQQLFHIFPVFYMGMAKSQLVSCLAPPFFPCPSGIIPCFPATVCIKINRCRSQLFLSFHTTGARIVRPPFFTSGPGLYVGTGLAPARFHPKDARKGFRPAGQNPSGTGTGVERPLIRHGICRDTFPPVGGRLFGRLEAAPTGSPSVFA